MITLEQAKSLTVGTILYHTKYKNADHTPMRWKVSGQPKTWKRDDSKVKVPVKFGLFGYDYVTEHDLHLVSLSPD